jgi:hypothetical protein
MLHHQGKKDLLTEAENISTPQEIHEKYEEN